MGLIVNSSLHGDDDVTCVARIRGLQISQRSIAIATANQQARKAHNRGLGSFLALYARLTLRFPGSDSLPRVAAVAIFANDRFKLFGSSAFVILLENSVQSPWRAAAWARAFNRMEVLHPPAGALPR